MKLEFDSKFHAWLRFTQFSRLLLPLTFLLSITRLLAATQMLDIHDTVRIYNGLTNFDITVSGQAELRVTGMGDPLPGCQIDLNSPDAWLLMTGILPSQVASTFLPRVRVNGASATLNFNC